jgi:hypothetical protein
MIKEHALLIAGLKISGSRPPQRLRERGDLPIFCFPLRGRKAKRDIPPIFGGTDYKLHLCAFITSSIIMPFNSLISILIRTPKELLLKHEIFPFCPLSRKENYFLFASFASLG